MTQLGITFSTLIQEVIGFHSLTFTEHCLVLCEIQFLACAIGHKIKQLCKLHIKTLNSVFFHNENNLKKCPLSRI